MKVTFIFVPPGGGEVDYQRSVDVPHLPGQGDYVQFEYAEGGYTYFIVRRVRWCFDREEVLEDVIVEAEFATGIHPSERHIASLQMYESRGKPPRGFEASGY